MPRLRVAWVEEWMSTLAAEVLPELAERHDITYVTAGTAVPEARFIRVIRGARWPYMNAAGFELAWRVSTLYRRRQIDVAAVWASIGFALRRVPFVNFEGGSVYAQIRMACARAPITERLRFIPGLVHYALPERLCNRRARHIVVPSQALKADLVRLHGVPESKVSVVSHGVSQRHLGIYRKRPTVMPPAVLFVGRLHPMKGIASIVREFERRRDIRADLVIVGDGPDRPHIEAVARADRRIKVLGSLNPEALEEILLRTNIFVFPTFHEGFGLALLEAMASGHACVTTDIPVTRELLGEAGRYVPVGDAAGLIEVVAELVESPAVVAMMSEAAHRRASGLTWTSAADQIDAVLKRVMTSRSPHRALVG